jgi:hypothetical protein
VSNQPHWELRAYGDATTLLFGPDGFRVVSVTREHEHDGQDDVEVREVVVEGIVAQQASPDCGVLAGAVHGRNLRLVKDLPHGRRPLRLRWDQRRWACRERLCRRRTLAETIEPWPIPTNDLSDHRGYVVELG